MSRFNTPLRYPGGKQKLTPFIVEVMAKNKLLGGEYAEPYAGGAGVGIQLLLSGRASRVHLNDASPAIYAFWSSVLHHSEEFCSRISCASLTMEEWYRQKEILSRADEFDVLDLGFSLFFLNRCNRSGIPTGGVIGGKNQTGRWKMSARFTRNELIRRVEAITAKKHLITIHNLDAEEFILNQVQKLPDNALVYCDPPYYGRSKRLYLNHYKEDDHHRIAETIQAKVKKPWLVSYDNAPAILGYYKDRKSFVYDLNYSAAKAVKGSEAFFFSDSLAMPDSSCVPSIQKALVASRS